MSATPRFRPPLHRGDKPVFILNTGLTRKHEGDVTMVHPDGRREAWKGRA